MSTNFDDLPIATKHHHNTADLNNFDDVPIGNASHKFVISEYAEGQTHSPPRSTANMTLEEKIQSKAVKIKLEGLEQLKALLNDTGKSGEIQIELSKILKENNPACLEKVLQCAQKWMDLNKSWGEKQVKQIIENGCVNGKGATKKLATDLIFKAFQSKPEEVQRTILEIGLKGKVPKIVGGYLAIINQLLQQFGIKDLKYLKPYISSVVHVMNNQKLPVVKAEGMNLFKSGLKWLGKDFLWPMFGDLKENMKKQLESFWETHDKKQVMKANRQKIAPTAPIKTEGAPKGKSKQNIKIETEPFQSGGLDIYQISDPIEVLQKFDEKWTESVLEAEKWNVKTALLQQIITKTSVPKIAHTEHRHITQMIRRLLNDSNFNVVLAVLKLSGCLAKSLRKNFSHSAKQLFPYITPKFRDKKTQMIEQTYNTLNNFSYCFSLEQVGEDIKTGLKDKTAGMKNNIIKWMTLFIEKRQPETGSERMGQFFKSSSILSIIENLLNDPSAQVRDSTTKLVCKVRATYGEGMFKNVDKNISNKDILQKLADGASVTDNEQPLTKSRNKDATSSKKLKSQSKNKSSKKQQDQEYESTSKNTYTIKTNSKGCDTIDITEELNKNLKKLNDNTNWQNRKQSAEKLIKYFNQIQNTNAKIVSPVLYDFLGVLKARIADPNKQLIKVFVGLVGEVFKYLSEKQAKIQGKFFIQELIEAYSDKNQINRKQINKTFDSISTSLGSETMINYFGQILTQEIISSSASSQSGSITKQFTLQYLLSSPYFLNKVDQIEGGNLKEFKQYPKIILTGLCDKNKDLRAVSERMFKLISQKTGTEIFRSFVNSKQQKSAFKGDLITFLDKFQGNVHEQPSMISNGSNLSSINPRQDALMNKRSPSMNKSKIGIEPEAADKNRRKLSNVTSLCNSRSKGKNNSVLGCEENSKDFTSNLSFYLKGDQPATKKIVEGQNFASLEILTSERIQREQSSTKYRNAQTHPITQQAQIQASISRLLNHQQLYLKMYSSDYNKNVQAAQKIIKLCGDVSQTNSIRQIYDLLIKWVVIKLYGGNVTALRLVELVSPVLSVLEKKRIGWTEADIEVLIYLIREFMICMFYDGSQNIEVPKNIIKLAIALSSGERILRKILNELRSDINQHHRHLSFSKRQGLTCNKYYKKYLAQICCFFIDYFSNDGLLGEAASIPELSQDQDFVRLLSNKFHEGVLREFGFKFHVEKDKEKVLENTMGINLEKSFVNAEKSPNSPRDGSPIAYFGGDKNKNQQKNKKVTPQKKGGISHLNQSQFPPPSPINKVRSIIQSNIESVPVTKKQPVSILSICRLVGMQPFSDRYQIETSSFNHPSHHNPLGSNLNKLYPYNESTIHFFSTLFQPQNQSSDKITAQLSTHCNLIYSTMMNTLIKIMQITNRQIQGPQKISIYMSLIQQSIKCPSIYKNLQEYIIQKSIRYIIDQLVFQDENRNSIEARLRSKGFSEFKSDVFVKGINGIMLRLLDNSYPLFLVNVLLFSMMEVQLGGRSSEDYHYGPSVNRNKKIGLLIRCFNRVTATYFAPNQKQKQPQNIYNIDEDPTCLKNPHIHKFLLLTREYLNIAQVTELAEFEYRQGQKMERMAGGNVSSCTTNNNNEQSIVLCLCKILRVLGRKNLLFKNYEQVKKQKGWNEKTLADFVLSVSGFINNNLDNHYAPTNNYQEQTLTSGHGPKIDEELRKIVQMLSKTKTFQEGVKNLKQYIQQSGGKFDYKNVFAKMNFEPAFIEKVTDEMGKLNILSSQSSSRSLNPDIQNKLEKLKMKLEGINNEHSRSISSKMTEEGPVMRVNSSNLNLTTISINSSKTQDVQTPRGRQISSRSIEQSTLQNDMKKRIEQMKNKVSMSTSGNMNGNNQRLR